ncbi:MAG: TetR/AcrR family transcriptional regulator [Coriobacteriia bacterium]
MQLARDRGLFGLRYRHRDDKRELIASEYLKAFDAGHGLLTVTAMTARLGISRNTYYYYFNSPEALHFYIFRRDMDTALKRRFNSEELVYGDPEEDDLAEYAYYARRVDASMLMHQHGVFTSLSHVLYERQNYYAELFGDNRKGSLLHYLFNLYTEVIRKDAATILANRHYPESALTHMSRWITSAFIYEIAADVMSRKSELNPSKSGPFLNMAHEILYMYRIFDYDPDSGSVIFPDALKRKQMGFNF